MNDLIPLGTDTPWGRVCAIALLSGEHYYFMVKGNDVAMMPHDAVESLSKFHAAQGREGE